MILRPQSWPETIQYLCEEQQQLELLRLAPSDAPTNAEEIDFLCLKYALTRTWPTNISESDRAGILQRVFWARQFCATLQQRFQMADGTETGEIPYPDWDFEPMFVWLLVDSWRLREDIQKDAKHPIPDRPSPSHTPGLGLT